MIVALDIGTTNVKATAFSLEGRVLASVEKPNQTFIPKPGWSEQRPELLFQNVLNALQDLARKMQGQTPRAVVFSSAMHGLMAVDGAGKPLTNIWTWADLRAEQEAQILKEAEGLEIYRRTGVPIHPMSPLLKVIWLKKNLPEVFARTRKYLGIKEYLWYRLTGKFESDLSCASASGFMNVMKNEWDEGALDAAGITREQLPRLVSTTHCVELQNLDGFSASPLLLVIGASDGALATLGSGATSPGQVSMTIGTSAAVRMMSDSPLIDEQMRTFCYRVDEQKYIVGGASNNGANVLEWLRTSVFRSNLSAEDFANQAASIASGADGLRFMPYLQGERAPIWDASAKASFTGLAAHHTQAHFVRAAMEGVLLNLKAIAEVLDNKTPILSLHLNGGVSQNQQWVRMLAEIFPSDVEIFVSETDASSLGAFLLGLEMLPKDKQSGS